VLAARLKWVERPFGMDKLLRYHRYIAAFALGLLLVHPVLLAASGTGKQLVDESILESGWDLLFSLDVPWYTFAGRAALILVIVNVLASVYQSKLRLKFEGWRMLHSVLGPVILVGGVAHAASIGWDLQPAAMRALFVTSVAAAAALFAFHRILRPWMLGRHPYTVAAVKQEAEGVWTIELKPEKGRTAGDYFPGQFHFLTLHRERGLPEEEHHWTISSSPARKDSVASTIKSLGDFTSTIGKTRVGDTATVHGAFGRFSHVIHPQENELVFIAGGIGITPMMGMLRYMRDKRDNRTVTLLYSNPEEKAIVFRKELDAIAAGSNPRLKIVYFLDKAPQRWKGETGVIDKEKVRHYCGETIGEKAFYVSGPAPMIKAVTSSLKELGAKEARVHTEIFSFLD
jgi:predicted ferric reductase